MIIAQEIESIQNQIGDIQAQLLQIGAEAERASKGLPGVSEAELVKLIRDKVKEQGITQHRLAETVGYSQSVISMAFRGKRRLPVSVMLRCLELVGYKLVAVPLELPFTPEGDDDESNASN